MDIQEIKEFLSKNEDARKEAVSFVSKTDEGKELLENYASSVKDTYIEEGQTSLSSKLLEVVKEKGLEVNTDNITDLVSSIVESNLKFSQKDDSEEIKSLKAKLDELKTSGEGAKEFKGMWEQATHKIEELNKAHSEEIASFKSEYEKSQISTQIDTILSSLKLQEMPEMAKKALIESTKVSLLDRAELRDGVVILKDSEGKIVMNDDYKSPADINTVVSRELKDLISDGNQNNQKSQRKIEQGKLNTYKNEKGEEIKSLSIPTSSYSNKEEFNSLVDSALKAEGIGIMSKEGIKIRAQTLKDNELI